MHNSLFILECFCHAFLKWAEDEKNPTELLISFC